MEKATLGLWCVFKPAFESKAAPGPGTISKLMIKKYANAEFDEKKVFSHYNQNSNFQKYFDKPIEWCILINFQLVIKLISIM